jgi:cytosine/adenosine deaminase-related metal-dependent hydrolase
MPLSTPVSPFLIISTLIIQHTTGLAKLLGMEGKIGELVPGAFADMIILSANPLGDITVLDQGEKHLMGVIKSGYVFSSKVDGLSVDYMP